MNIKVKFYLYFVAISLLPIPIIMGITTSNAWLLLFGLLYFGLYILIRSDFLLPFDQLQKWVKSYKINQNVRLVDNKKSSFQVVAKAINHLIDENQHLYDDMEKILNKQIQRLSKKSASLETLYGVSSELNKIQNSDELLEYFLDIFVNMTGACSASVRILSDEGSLNLVATRGVIDTKKQEKQVLSSDCFCGEVALGKDSGVSFSVHSCGRCVGSKAQEKAKVGTIFIPLRHQGKTLGIFNLFFDKEPSLAQDERALLESIAENIAISLDKSLLNEQTKRMELSQQRIFLSQEIHDSLAQTIYSLKLQVRVLKEMLNNQDSGKIDEKISELQSSITQANQDLRELMSNFRTPLDPKGIKISLRNLVNRVKSETGISVYLQIKGVVKFSPEVEMQIMSIVQEALSNIRKHANANMVRILLTDEPYSQLLIEDDGKGFKKSDGKQEIMGNNIGINIMKERAEHIGATIEIESEINEGTRIMINFAKKQ